MKSFTVFSDPLKLYKKMLSDIDSAKVSIYLETYIYDDDYIGNKFRQALVKKAQEGVKVMLLLDAWGSTVKPDYFKELVSYGGKVQFFREFRYVLRIFSKNHERNHRKMLLIDGKYTYVGSANITATCIYWREIILRIEGPITKDFENSFFYSWKTANNLIKRGPNSLIHESFEILQDIPSSFRKHTERKYVKLIDGAKKEILIETPYFVPSGPIRKAFQRAVKRGVEIKLVLPYSSDVKIMDIARNRYLGSLYENGVNMFMYYKKVLHSKLLIIDDSFFILGSSNVDYRSFIHNYEINLLGIDVDIIKALKEYFKESLAGCKPFNYNEWKNRPSHLRLLEKIISFMHIYL